MSGETGDRPNILYLHSHDTGRYIQPYGYAIATPHLQVLADQGMVFRHAFTVAPTCSPSRACLLTGECAHSNGMLGLAHRGWRLDDYGKHIIHTLHPLGYRSALAGVQHITTFREGRGPLEAIGYGELLDTHGRGGEGIAEAAVEFLSRPHERPFFLSVGFVETHRRFPEPGLEDDPRWCRPPMPIPDTEATRRDAAAFRATARVLDRNMGTVLAALDTNGLTDGTLVVCTTDHGIAFPSMKCNLTVHGTGVMLMMRGPGGFAGGRVCDALVSQLDVYPTVCDLLGVARPDRLQGRSLMPIVRGEADEVNDEIYGEVTYHAAYEPQRSVRTKRWCYIRRFGGRDRPVLPNCDDSPSKDVWLEHGWRDRATGEEQFYDCVFDPNEANNVAGRPEARSVLDEMRGRLDAWMRRTDDPLLAGPVPAPSGAEVNDPDDLSPNDPVTRIE
jgi:N-sulfoglucosamine sulfohydrolase